MNPLAKEQIIANYRSLFHKYGSGPEATQGSREGQRFRFAKLAEIADLRNRRVLDLGCGIGDFYRFLIDKFGAVDYTGIDIVPEMVGYAAQQYQQARFLCRDVLSDGLDEIFDYVLICGVFNNSIPDCTTFLKDLATFGLRHCSQGLGFNFISTHVNYTEPEMAYHDPAEVLDFCIKSLSRKLTMHHHYERCDVAVFLYK